eukprot:TRINITY_DN17234_c0_g1_i2.p1 TRINITY_DN17234_c0_g1~~TRINITY_DN17234_c0_g1_i2.p1  ORF type:complete len:521 (+),score=120.58 TRINITY_DN17234_c0_g1_i2:25-1563(+)
MAPITRLTWIITSLLVMVSLAKVPSLPKNPVLYEISARPYLYELSQRGISVTGLSSIPDSELDNLQNMGVDIVYMMGVWSLGPNGLAFDQMEDKYNNYKQNLPDFTKEDIIGSPYAVTQYTLNPALGSPKELTELRQRLNKRGMRLMLDFVPNHSATDASTVESDEDFYVKVPYGTQPPYDSSLYMESGIAYGRDPYSGGWRDTAQWNIWNNATITHNIDALLQVAAAADGIRCDMSMLLLNDIFESTWGDIVKTRGYNRPQTEFWTTALTTVRSQFPDMFFMAECYWNTNAKLHSLGFDYTYDKDIYDKIAAQDIGGISGWTDNWNKGYLGNTAHFVENHDEQRAVVEFGSAEQSFAAAVLVYGLPGIRFINHGQLEGQTSRLDVHLRRIYKPETNVGLKMAYESVFTKVFPFGEGVTRNGEWERIDINGDWRLMTYNWNLDGKNVLFACNILDEDVGGRAIIKECKGDKDGRVMFEDVISGKTYSYTADEISSKGLYVGLGSHQCQVFKY